jgi:hypothetical protein
VTRRYPTPPSNRRSLDQRLRNIAEDDEVQLRMRRHIANMAVIGALAAHAHDDDGKPLFVV